MTEPEGAPAAELPATAPDQPAAPPPPAVPSAGSQLRSAREAAGLSLEALSQTLKVATAKLTALEAGQLDELPSPMFTRALASSVCRVLNIDPAPVLNQLPQNDQFSFERAQSGLNAPFRANAPRPMTVALKLLKSPLALVVLALLVGALVMLLVPSIPPVDNLVNGLKNSAETPSAAVTPPPGAAAAASTGSVNAVVIAPSLVPATPVPPASDVASPTLTPAVSLRSESSVPAVLGFKARASVWIEVTDARGRTPLRRLVNAGEVVQVDGTPPMLAVVGRADVVDVEVRGKPLDITARAKDNVARFEVK